MTAGSPAPRVKVLGIGNVLMTDDGLGPWVIHHLESLYDFPAEVVLLDLGTPGLDLIPHLSDADVAILVDTVKADAPPGTVRLYGLDEILAHPPSIRVSPHDPALKETLLTLRFSGSGPKEVLFIGVVPGSVGKGTELTPAVFAAIETAACAVLGELERRSLHVTPKAGASVAPPWWGSALELPARSDAPHVMG